MGIRGNLAKYGLDVALYDDNALDVIEGLDLKIAGDQVPPNNQSAYFGSDGNVLDLTDASTPSTVTLASSGDLLAAKGGDIVVPVAVYAYVTTAVAADSTAPVVTIQDGAGNSTGLTLTLTDGDAVDDIALATLSDGTGITAVDLTSENLRAAVTTAAADAGTATGECKIIVECLLWK